MVKSKLNKFEQYPEGKARTGLGPGLAGLYCGKGVGSELGGGSSSKLV